MRISLCKESDVWNRAALHLGGTLYHSWEWGEVRQAEGWLPWRVLAQDDSTPRAMVHLLEKRLPMGAGSLLYGTRGIIGGESEPLILEEFVGWLKDFARKRKAFLLRLDPAFPDTDETKKSALTEGGLCPLPDQWSFWNFPRGTMVVDLSGTEEEVLRRMRRTHRQLIQKAAKDQLTVENGTTEDQLRDFYDLLQKSSERQGFALQGIEHFKNIRERFLVKGRGLLFLSRLDNRAVAAILCVCFGHSCHYIHGGFDPEARQPGSTEILHWKAMQWARSEGCQGYDMLGTGTSHPPKEGNRGYGLYNYKKGFGAKLMYSAGYFDLVRGEGLYRLLRYAERHPRLIDLGIKIRSLV